MEGTGARTSQFWGLKVQMAQRRLRTPWQMVGQLQEGSQGDPGSRETG